MSSTSVRKGITGFSPTTFMAVPSAWYDASLTSGVVSFTVCKQKHLPVQTHAESETNFTYQHLALKKPCDQQNFNFNFPNVAFVGELDSP